MNTGSPTLLGESDDGCGDASGHRLGVSTAADRHCQIGVLINDCHDIRQEPMTVRRKKMALLEFLVILLDIRHISLAKQFIALLHLGHERLQDLLCLVGFLDNGILLLVPFIIARHDRQIMMKKTTIVRELDHLRIYEDELQLRRML